MSWQFDYFKTDFEGVISGYQTLSNIILDFSIEETVGDEFYVRGGDISLRMESPLPFDSGLVHNWLALYHNGALVNVYWIGGGVYNKSFEERDDKTGEYSTRLVSIQQRFFYNLQESVVGYTTFAQAWAYNMLAAMVTIEKLAYDPGPPVQYLADRWGIHLGNMLTNINGRTNSFGYRVGGISLPSSLTGTTDVPILFRGQSLANTDTEQNLMNQMFGGYDLTWKDIFELALTAYNAVIRVTPNLTGGSPPTQLDVQVDVVPRTGAAATTPVTVEWRERKYIPYRYWVQGVRITGPNNTNFRYGAFGGQNVVERSVEAGNPPGDTIAASDDTLYLATGTLAAGKYGILDVNGLNEGYWIANNLNSRYADLVNTGHGYEGEITYNGEKALDQVQIGTDVAQLLTIRQDHRGIASVEAIVI